MLTTVVALWHFDEVGGVVATVLVLGDVLRHRIYQHSHPQLSEVSHDNVSYGPLMLKYPLLNCLNLLLGKFGAPLDLLNRHSTGKQSLGHV